MGYTPAALQRRPTLNPKYRDLYRAFGILSSRRKFSEVGQQPIEFSELVSFLNEFQIKGEKREIWVEAIVAIDNKFLDLQFEMSKSKKKEVIVEE